MGKIIDVIVQVITSKAVGLVIIGLLFIVMGVVMGVFKRIGRIQGISDPHSEEGENYVAIFFGLLFGFFGGFMSLGVFICTYFDIMDYFRSPATGFLLMLFAFFLAFLCLIVIAMVRNYREKNKLR